MNSGKEKEEHSYGKDWTRVRVIDLKVFTKKLRGAGGFAAAPQPPKAHFPVELDSPAVG